LKLQNKFFAASFTHRAGIKFFRMNIQSFYHLSLSVSNINTVAAWYKNLLGFTLITPRLDFTESSGYCFLELNGFKLELVEDKHSKPFRRDSPPLHSLLQGVTHFSFKVDDLTAAIQSMKENNVEIVIEDFTVTAIKNRIMIVRDPDGNLVEFVEEQ
jgi:catechol 2,3-dioxygenase-like lactoylglutathione lyase family enzyme